MPLHSRPAVGPDRVRRLALSATLALAWVNLACAGRWAEEPGSLHGPRFPLYLALLGAATVLAILWRPAAATPATRGEARAVATLGAALLAAALLAAFPPGTWTQVPFYDDWPGLLQLTLNGMETLRHGAVVGWQWAFLGGYPTAADLSQSLAVPAWIPITLAGPLLGFHLFLAAVILVIPLIVGYDVWTSDGPVAGGIAAGLSAIVTAGYFHSVMYSGMANSTAGAAMVAAALSASHAARRGRRWGGPAMALALTLTLYSHAAFYIYGAVCLAVESVFYRDWRGAWRSAAALGVAFVAALPLHWELLRYPGWFVTNNLYFESPASFDYAGLARQVWYATEMLGRPDRWFNDYGGLTYVWLPVLIWAGWHDRRRTGYYVWATLAIVLTLRLNAPQLGLVAGRQLHLLPVLLGPALAGFVATQTAGGRWGRLVLPLLIAAFVAVPYRPVPHVTGVEVFNPPLVQRVTQAAGSMVLLENNPHWDMISDPSVRTERSRFDVHYESLLPQTTGKRFFGQPQDGYHRSRFRGAALAGGGLAGQAIGTVAPETFGRLMRDWGVAHLFVWSAASRAYLARHPDVTRVWQDGTWEEYVLRDADTRSVITVAGQGQLEQLTPVGGRVALEGVPRGSEVVVRTHYHPAWSASADGREVALRSSAGQLAFDNPVDGRGSVALAYDRRVWLSMISLLGLGTGLILLARYP